MLLTSFIFIALCAAAEVKAEKMFSVTSEPGLARVEINGQSVCTTSLRRKMKGFYFNGPKYLWSDWLGEPMQMKIGKEGCVSQQALLLPAPTV